MSKANKATEPTDPTDDEAQDLRLIFEHSTNEIRFLKSQQWTITNYVVAIYVAVLAVSSILESNFSCGVLPCEHYFLAIAAALAMIVGISIVRRIDKDLTKNRKRVDRSIAGLSQAFRDALVPVQIAVREKTSVRISAALKAVILFGGLVVIYLIVG